MTSIMQKRPAAAAPAKRKYNNKKVVVDGIQFDSIKEARHYTNLTLLARAGQIRDLRLQVTYDLAPKVKLDGRTKPALRYKADFVYFDVKVGREVVEDVKGMRTKEYRIKRHLMMSVHGIEVREV